MAGGRKQEAESGPDHSGLRTPVVVPVLVVRVASVPVRVSRVRVVAPPVAGAAVSSVAAIVAIVAAEAVAIRVLAIVAPVRVVVPEHRAVFIGRRVAPPVNRLLIGPTLSSETENWRHATDKSLPIEGSARGQVAPSGERRQGLVAGYEVGAGAHEMVVRRVRVALPVRRQRRAVDRRELVSHVSSRHAVCTGIA